jgi:hypothetical protein
MTTIHHVRDSDADERPAQTDKNSTQTDLRSFGFLPASQLRMTDLGEHSERE